MNVNNGTMDNGGGQLEDGWTVGAMEDAQITVSECFLANGT